MKWSPQQELALVAVSKWMQDPNADQVFYLAGYAGTGKSTIAKHLVDSSDKRWLFAAYTGKAAHVLRQKGCSGAGTIHSIIYKPVGEKDSSPRFSLYAASDLASISTAGIVIDEVSMVDEKLGRDLESFGKKILVLGDPAQLPPVKGGGYFTNREPNIVLTEVHRHARESGVLRLATHIREGGTIASFTSLGTDVDLISRSTDRDERTRLALAADQVLVGRNKTRHELNKRSRELLGREGEVPVSGDRLVCLRNVKDFGLFNGSQWIVDGAVRHSTFVVNLRIDSEEDDTRTFSGEAWMHYFIGRGDEIERMSFSKRRLRPEFDWGYALTVHKAQGSQWERVFVNDESLSFREEPHRWLYTAVTRAAKHVAVMSL